MPQSYFLLELDTTAPVVEFGTPTGLSAGQTLIVPYSVTEYGIFSADFVDALGKHMPMNIGPAELTLELPVDVPAGNSRVQVITLDEVGNSSTFDLAITIEGIGIEPSVGGAVPITGPSFRRFQQEFPATVSLGRESELSIPAVATLRDAVQPFELSFSSSVSLGRIVEFVVEGNRLPSVHLTTIKREDDELLMWA